MKNYRLEHLENKIQTSKFSGWLSFTLSSIHIVNVFNVFLVFLFFFPPSSLYTLSFVCEFVISQDVTKGASNRKLRRLVNVLALEEV